MEDLMSLIAIANPEIFPPISKELQDKINAMWEDVMIQLVESMDELYQSV